MSDTQAYNGWCNYETWLANCWISSNEQGYKLLVALKASEDSLGDKADLLKSYYDLELYIGLDLEKVFSESGLLIDLLRNAFSRINWAEIVQDS